MSFSKKCIVVLCLILAIVGVRFVYNKYQAREARIEAVRIAAAAKREEVTLTIIPGWTLRQVADYLVLKGFATTTRDVYALTGEPAMLRSRQAGPPFPSAMDGLYFVERKPDNLSQEGYLAPETYRVYRNASLLEVVQKLLTQRNKELETIFPGPTEKTAPFLDGRFSDVSYLEIMTMASIIEKETRADEDRSLVADILWRRYEKKWALQVDSSVHYAVDRTGDVFTTAQERTVLSPWNTYKYPGLPPGPICNPSVESIKAALNPEKNSYWYFLTGSDGKMHYARTLEEHNANRAKYL